MLDQVTWGEALATQITFDAHTRKVSCILFFRVRLVEKRSQKVVDCIYARLARTMAASRAKLTLNAAWPGHISSRLSRKIPAVSPTVLFLFYVLAQLRA